jgi:RNA polymerase sigma factor (sigma-70 family)
MTTGPVDGDAVEKHERPTADVVRTLVANHRQFLAFLESRVKSRALAEDILQDAFVRGVNKLDTLRSDESAIAWFYRVLRNAIIDHRRRLGAAERKLAAFGQEVEDRLEPDIECVALFANASVPSLQRSRLTTRKPCKPSKSRELPSRSTRSEPASRRATPVCACSERERRFVSRSLGAAERVPTTAVSTAPAPRVHLAAGIDSDP